MIESSHHGQPVSSDEKRRKTIRFFCFFPYVRNLVSPVDVFLFKFFIFL